MWDDLPSLELLRTFEIVARHQSFTGAASELHITQAAVSHQIRTLEEFLGYRLFIRKERPISLTPEGQVLPVTVIEVDEASVTLDANHRLAGQDLVFDVELVAIA